MGMEKTKLRGLLGVPASPAPPVAQMIVTGTIDGATYYGRAGLPMRSGPLKQARRLDNAG
jgi:hypothetical protein